MTQASPFFALVGAPNSGKTTLFNALTGLRAKTGNYPGVTVERHEGVAFIENQKITLLDLPGTYSFEAISPDERATINCLKELDPKEAALEGIVVVADATTLEKSLPMVAEVLLLNKPTLLALTMVDELKARGGVLDLFTLQRELGIPVVGIVGNQGIGLDDIKSRLLSPLQWARATTLPSSDIESRFSWSDALIKKSTRNKPEKDVLTTRLDRVFLHPILGAFAFFAFIAILFQAIFTLADPAMEGVSLFIDQAANWILKNGPNSFISSLLADGILRGVGAVVVFIPQLALLFSLLLFFESTGYLARAAFLIDRGMGLLGLEGRCFISLLSSYACAVPGVMATRSIPSPKDRLATILVAPFATCSARLPVYVLLIGAFIPNTPVFGGLTLQGLSLLGLYLLGGLSAILFAGLFKRGLLRGASLPFYLELPPYRIPSFRSLGIQVWQRLLVFLKHAGKIILLGSIALWFLLNHPKPEIMATKVSSQVYAQKTIENSYAAKIGKALEPVFSPLGFDWKINVGLIGSFAARELMISTMAQVYAIGDGEKKEQSLQEKLARIDVETGAPALSFASALSLLIFFVYALLCLSTIAAVKRETGTWRWPIFMFIYMFSVAWTGAFITYQIAS